MIINKSGITIRISVSELREMGRATQGVRIIKLRENDSIAAVAKVPAQKDEDLEENKIIEPNNEQINDSIENKNDIADDQNNDKSEQGEIPF